MRSKLPRSTVSPICRKRNERLGNLPKFPAAPISLQQCGIHFFTGEISFAQHSSQRNTHSLNRPHQHVVDPVVAPRQQGGSGPAQVRRPGNVQWPHSALEFPLEFRYQNGKTADNVPTPTGEKRLSAADWQCVKEWDKKRCFYVCMCLEWVHKVPDKSKIRKIPVHVTTSEPLGWATVSTKVVLGRISSGSPSLLRNVSLALSLSLSFSSSIDSTVVRQAWEWQRCKRARHTHWVFSVGAKWKIGRVM